MIYLLVLILLGGMFALGYWVRFKEDRKVLGQARELKEGQDRADKNIKRRYAELRKKEDDLTKRFEAYRADMKAALKAWMEKDPDAVNEVIRAIRYPGIEAEETKDDNQPPEVVRNMAQFASTCQIGPSFTTSAGTTVGRRRRR